MKKFNNNKFISCPVCVSDNIEKFFENLDVPVHCNLLWASREEAISAPRGEIRLGFCKKCGHIFNQVFNPEMMKYTQTYENSLHFSPRFQNYLENLVTNLIAKYQLRNKNIIEIGCGQGDFLTQLCKLGNNYGVGFDPGHRNNTINKSSHNRVTFVQDFYSKHHAHYQADLICCRHVLEHIHNPKSFLNNIRRAIGDRLDTVIFFEVPYVLFTLRDLAIWDIIYEHFSYFSRTSLNYLFHKCGFEVNEIITTYEGQFICIEASIQKESAAFIENDLSDLQVLAHHVATFSERYEIKKEKWSRYLRQIEKGGQRAVIWGAGSKGVTFLNALKVKEQIEYVIDINPRKHNMYIAGTGQQIVAPDFLKEYRPDKIIIMNPIYLKEIQQIVQEMNMASEFMVIQE